MMTSRTRTAAATRWAAILTVAAMPAVAAAQATPQGAAQTPPAVQRPTPPAAQPAAGQGGRGAQPTRRRALDIRSSAPAPEVVTVRPREIPAFSRALLVPAVIAPPADAKTSGTVVIFPGPVPGVQTPKPPSE